MNVLVYSGPQVLQASLNHTLSILRSLLLPQYAVQPITQQALNAQPWAVACALLVFPRCSDNFQSPSIKAIQAYIEGGGAYLALGTGAKCVARGLGIGGSGLSFGISQEQKPLRFYDKPSNSYVYPRFPGGDAGALRSVSLRMKDGTVMEGIREIGTNEFEGFEAWKGASVLARYIGGEFDDALAAVTFNVGNGVIALWGPSLEYPVGQEGAKLSQQEFDGYEKIRHNVMKLTLLQLGVQFPTEEEPVITRPLSQFLVSAPGKPSIVTDITSALASPSSGAQLSVFEDANDTFHFHPLSESSKLLEDTRNAAEKPSDPSSWQPKHVIICLDELPSREQTPLFDLALYFKLLENNRGKGRISTISHRWGFGEALLYGEAVTSTQTMLDKNPRLLSTLPAPILSIASYQLAGRGRGSNVWLSPTGCLQFSLLLRVSLSALPAIKLVFIQYLFALAVVEAFHEEAILGKKADRVRLKWPNDIYALVGLSQEKKKIGGILVSTSFLGGNVDIVIGCGLNLFNLPPMSSVSQLLPAENRASLSMECTAAAIMLKFETMWTTFVRERGSFDSFMNLYLQRWLHSDQLVTLTNTTPHTPVRITGITSDYGLLRTVPDRTGWGETDDEGYIDLQPDGNSFDMMAGLIKAKS